MSEFGFSGPNGIQEDDGRNPGLDIYEDFG